jgi:membrane-associated phospholipid phosphatase
VVATAGGLLATFGVLAIVVAGNHRLGVDDAWWRWMVDGRTTVLVDASLGLDHLGGSIVQLVVRVAVAIVLVLRSWPRRLVAWVLLALCSTPICDMMKAMVDRPRPAAGLVHAGGAAFPSGHALAATVTALGIVVALTAPGRSRRIGWVLAGVYVGAMAWSRTLLGVHWLTDVVGGILLGSALTLGAFGLAGCLGSDRRIVDEAASGRR